MHDDDTAHRVDRATVFVPLVGQYDNIGDVILRRVLLEWLDTIGTLHIYVGRSPSSYDAALGLGSHHKVYRSASEWMRAMIATPSHAKPHYVFKPGEIQLTWTGLKEHVGVLPGIAAIKLRGGKAVRVGVGARSFHAGPMIFFRPSVLLSDSSFWRDRVTASMVGRGDVMPDLAFAAGSPRSQIAQSGARPVLAVSLRSDAPYPRTEWFEGLKIAAAAMGLRIVVVAQVERDVERSRELAISLGGEKFSWNPDAAEQERALREIYAQTLIVVSDRLHVLIAAFTEGAVPIAATDKPTNKIARHFEAAGLDEVEVDVSCLDAAGIAEALSTSAKRRDVLLAGLAAAREDIERVREQIIRQLSH